jgi:hypothetical protein
MANQLFGSGDILNLYQTSIRCAMAGLRHLSVYLFTLNRVLTGTL